MLVLGLVFVFGHTRLVARTYSSYRLLVSVLGLVLVLELGLGLVLVLVPVLVPGSVLGLGFVFGHTVCLHEPYHFIRC